MKKVAIVVQRYGKDVLGGSESLARDIAACIKDAYDVEVLTTCAREYTTWANYYEPGESAEDGVKVIRFKTDMPRSAFFKPWNLLLKNMPHTIGMERLWMRMQGPYSSALIRHVAGHKNKYDAFVFLTYLYATTYYCLPLVKEKALLVPTAHDEPFIRFRIFRDVFKGGRKLIYLTDEEKSFADSLFDLGPTDGKVVGAPISEIGSSAETFRAKYGIDGDFILYVGRLERMKGVDTLLEYYERYCREHEGLKLVLCGNGPMKIPVKNGIIPLGFVSDTDKFGAMKAAKTVVVPSRFESFSYSLLEAMLCCTPALVNGECKVLKGHCEKSGGCACYDSYETFKGELNRLLDDDDLRRRMGEAGKAYVRERYSSDAVGKKYISSIDGLVNERQTDTA